MISFVKISFPFVLLSLFLLSSCTNNQGINSYLNDDQLLLKTQADILKQWLSKNSIENNQVKVFTKKQTNYEDFAITINDKKIVSIRAKSVPHLASLSGLKNLDSLIVYNALFHDFSDL